MSDLTREIDATVAALAADPAAADHVGVGRAVLVLSVPPDRVLWASESAAGLRAAMETPDGFLRASVPALDRLRALARDLTSDLITVVERIRLRPGGDQLTVAFRRLHLSQGDALLAALVRRDDEPFVFEAPEDESLAATGPATAMLDGPDGVIPSRASVQPDKNQDEIERVRRQGLRRFIWSTDREGRFTSVSAPLGEVVGAANAAITGRLWRDLLDVTVLDEAGIIEACIAKRATWSNETVLWRVAGTDLVVPVELGGMPIFGRGHELDGYRGFGLCRSEDVQVGPRPLVRDEPLSFDVADQADFGEAHAPAGTLDDTPSPAEDGARPSLSVSEQGALREIARALGAKVEQDEGADGAPVSAEIVPLLHAGREPDLVKVLDRLPTGVLALRGETPIFVNRFALDLLDYPDLATLVAEGGASRIFAGHFAAGRDSALARATSLVARTGRTVHADVRLTTVEWGEQAASLVLIRPVLADERTPLAASSAETESLRTGVERGHDAERILALSGLALATLDEAGRIVSLNEAAERLFGCRTRDLAGESCTALLPLDSHPAVIGLLEEARRSGPHETGREIEVTSRAPQGGDVTLLMRVGRLSSGTVARFCMLFRDVSAFRAAQRELDLARRNAEDESARRAEFLARVSHEIRTPLNAIIGFTDLMAEERFGPIGNERYRAYLKDIHDSGTHVVSLVNDLLDLAKVTAGKIDLDFASLDLGSVAGQAVGMMQAVAARQRIVLRASYAPGLPRIAADERSIRQIVLNVLANALRFTPAGGQVIVSTSLTDRGEIALRVRDTGSGMSPEDVDTALKPFRQLPKAGRQEGTGLGLPLSKALTEANHGAFVIRSARGQGTLIEMVFSPERS